MSGNPGTPKPARGAYYTLGVLFLVLLFSVTDRYLLSILLVPIQDEMQVSDTAMGFLTGLAFARLSMYGCSAGAQETRSG